MDTDYEQDRKLCGTVLTLRVLFVTSAHITYPDRCSFLGHTRGTGTEVFPISQLIKGTQFL